MEKFKEFATNPRVLLVIAVFLVLMNLVDGGLTIWAIYIAKIAYEANPLMAAVMSVSPGLFLALKVIVPVASAVILYKFKDHRYRGIRVATAALWFCFFWYLGLMIYFAVMLHIAVSTGLI